MSQACCYKNKCILQYEIVNLDNFLETKLRVSFEMPGTVDFGCRLQVCTEGNGTWLSQKPGRNRVSAAAITTVLEGPK